jgi:hypothetical protein
VRTLALLLGLDHFGIAVEGANVTTKWFGGCWANLEHGDGDVWV